MQSLSRQQLAFAVALWFLFVLPTPSRGQTGGAAPAIPEALAGTASILEPAVDGPIASPEPDWPQWRGPRRDGVSRETGLLGNWPKEGPRLLWKFDRLGVGWASPIVVGDAVYIAGDVEDDLVIFALDRSGKVRWQTANGTAWKGSFPGSRACCVYSEGKLYHANAHGRVACLDAATGKEIWSVPMLEKFQARNITWAISECLLVDGPRLIVTPGGKEALMAALDKRNGQTLWTTEPIGEDQTSYSSPILFQHAGRRLLANTCSSHGFGVDAETGRLLWTVPLRNQYGVNVTTPVYGSGSIFYVTAYTPAVAYRLRTDGNKVAADRAWTCSLDTVTGGAVLVDEVLYASRYSKPKWWFSTDWKTGRTLSELKDLTTGAAIYAEGRLYCMAEDGAVSLLNIVGGRLESAGRFRMVPKRVSDAWAHPVLAGGRLYVRYGETLRCYDVRAK